ncbi:transcriptional regulator [Erwinia tracheiphila]|uniref:Transcriptional regulator n=1 Tax=Erwinia tracheiphila TaxID=65700 RepID=A0A345CXX7_9GAMM|nr:transcriptional regulator [Erwinia tracheiphila]
MCCQNCGQRAIIKKTERIHPHLYTLYCSCTDTDCQQKFAAQFSFIKTQVPGATASSRLIHDLIKYIPNGEYQGIIDALNNFQKSNHEANQS